MNWIDIGAIEDIPLRGARMVRSPAGDIAIFRTDVQELHATADRCAPRCGPLSEGIVHGTHVTCPITNIVFDMLTGDATGADTQHVDTYAVRVEDGRILLEAGAIQSKSAA